MLFYIDFQVFSTKNVTLSLPETAFVEIFFVSIYFHEDFFPVILYYFLTLLFFVGVYFP